MAQESARVIEQEIAQLSRAIEEKRAILERENKIVEEKELVRTAVQETVAGLQLHTVPLPAHKPPASPQPRPAQPKPTAKHYLDNLDEESVNRVQLLVDATFHKGIKKTVEEVQHEEAFIIDAYHDALVDKLYEELKARGIVK